jgi:hypothetical protein
MLPSNRVKFILEKRMNLRQKNEWALNVTFRQSIFGSWSLKTWPKKPTPAEVDATKTLILKSFEFYHENLRFPNFDIQEA